MKGSSTNLILEFARARAAKKRNSEPDTYVDTEQRYDLFGRGGGELFAFCSTTALFRQLCVWVLCPNKSASK